MGHSNGSDLQFQFRNRLLHELRNEVIAGTVRVIVLAPARTQVTRIPIRRKQKIFSLLKCLEIFYMLEKI